MQFVAPNSGLAGYGFGGGECPIAGPLIHCAGRSEEVKASEWTQHSPARVVRLLGVYNTLFACATSSPYLDLFGAHRSTLPLALLIYEIFAVDFLGRVLIVHAAQCAKVRLFVSSSHTEGFDMVDLNTDSVRALHAIGCERTADVGFVQDLVGGWSWDVSRDCRGSYRLW